jgi:nucleotide-binding universal stress UspA family protein
MLNFKNILFPIEFSQRDEAAAPFVLSMAQRYHARIVVLHVLQPPTPLYTGVNEGCVVTFDYDSATEDLRTAVAKFAATQLPKTEVECVVLTGDPAGVISEYAGNQGVDLICMPTHGYGVFRRALLGSVTAKVLHDSAIPVWTSAHAPEPTHRAHPQPRRIVCALDMKPESRHTLEAAVALANHSGARLEVAHVPAETVSPEAADRHLQELLSQVGPGLMDVSDDAPAAGHEDETQGASGGVAEIVRNLAVRKRADLVVIGRGAIRTVGFGRLHANCYDIIRESPCPVISV